MYKILSSLSKALLGIMVAVILVSGGVVIALRGLEKSISKMREAEYVARDRVETSSLIAHGYWVFDRFDYSDYVVANLDSLLKSSTRPIVPDPDAMPEKYQASQYYSCNYSPKHGEGYFYWASFKEIGEAAQFKAYLSTLNKHYPYSLISDRYSRYYHDKQYDKRNRQRFFKMFGLPDPLKFEPVIVMTDSQQFYVNGSPGVGADMDGLQVKSVEKDRLVLTYKDSNGILDLVYKNKNSLPAKPLSYSVYFKGQ